MKSIITIILVFGLGSVVANAAEKFGFINPIVLLERSPQAQQATRTMQQEFKAREDQLRQTVTEINTMEQAHQKDKAIMSAEQSKKVEDEIIQRKRKFQFDQQLLKEDIEKRRAELMKEVEREVTQVIRSYGSAQGYDFIFTEGVAFVSKDSDITEEILQELTK